jgi:hypothetical protein
VLNWDTPAITRARRSVASAIGAVELDLQTMDKLARHLGVS